MFDTNVLLNLYRFAPAARSELLSAFERLGDRVYVPHQVALEFHRNRLDVIADNQAAYQAALDSISANEERITEELKEKIRHLSNRIALPEGERERLIAVASATFRPMSQALDQLRANHGIDDPMADDPILDRLEVILSGKVGKSFSPERESEEQTEAARRNSEKVPPGYKDAPKHGDYFTWKQTLDEVKARQSGLLVFVTGDVKEDWYLRVKGKTVCARPELAAEAESYANTRLVLMRTESFLRYAAAHLDASVSEDTIRQAEKLPDRQPWKAAQARKFRQNLEHHLLEIDDALADSMESVAIAQKELAEATRLYEESLSTGVEGSSFLEKISLLEGVLDRATRRHHEIQEKRQMLRGQIWAIDHFGTEQRTVDAKAIFRRNDNNPAVLLNRRETEILAAMSEGLTNQEIAERLPIKVGALALHIRNILHKLNVRTRVQAVDLYLASNRPIDQSDESI
ncbi:PIN-like domain-containing protein [Micromonospora sp. S-DT3-3-22]|uniref:PIN-like domain-containing protein n=1 Tax=Micromonospora sp. S-DT3-3-22 TaxID=2755359 RepID=UPI0018904B47|nr:PIN-like domain-containing protein [Micromonospora sp. S-DT3-3-22]